MDALGEGLDDLAVLLDLADLDAVVGTAVVLPDDDLLGHVHQTAGQVTESAVRRAVSAMPSGRLGRR